MSPIGNTLVSARWLITATADGVRAIEQAALIFNESGIITAVGTATELASAENIAHRVALPNHVLAPGLVNAHCHAAMCLLRGAADDLPLHRWLQERIWPMEGELLDEAFVQTGTQLAAVEMILGGTTTCADMYFYSRAAGRAFLSIGMRGVLTLPVIDFPTHYASDADAYITTGLLVRDELADEPLLSFALAPHAPYTVCDATFSRVLAFANELGLPVHTHLQETAQEITDALAQSGERPTARLARLGALGPDFFAAHGVHLNDEDIATLARYGSSIVHCPSSNLKLASGLAPVAQMLAAGINVGLGTDGAASNNRLDMFEEMRLAALIGKVQANDASAVNATQAFTMATLGGARATGLGAVTGSLEIGKSADLIALSLDSPGMTPLFDPVSHFVYAASRADVIDVWVAGVQRVKDGALTGAAAHTMAELAPNIQSISARVAALRK